MSRMDSYHVMLGKKRTTVSLDNIISILLALKLGVAPRSKEAHSAVREHLQEKLREAKDPGRIFVSQWLREQCLFDLLDNKISNSYDDWFFETEFGRPRNTKKRK